MSTAHQAKIAKLETPRRAESGGTAATGDLGLRRRIRAKSRAAETLERSQGPRAKASGRRSVKVDVDPKDDFVKTKDETQNSKDQIVKTTEFANADSPLPKKRPLKTNSRDWKTESTPPAADENLCAAPPPPPPRDISLLRISDLLKGVLTKNPDLEVFTIEAVMRAIGEERFEANLLFATLPSLEAAPEKPEFIEISAALVAGQLAVGRPKISLPRALLEKEIPRQSLAIAIHAALPVIEAAETIARPRIRWLSHPISRRILGAFLFVLTATVAFPLIGFDPLQSLSTFAITFGMAEGDGAAILLGVALGAVALGFIAASNFSPRALRAKAASWLRKLGRKLGGSLLARFCDRVGLSAFAKLLRFEWRQILLLWRPEPRSSSAFSPFHAPPESA